MPSQFTADEIIKDVRNVYARLGHVPSREEFLTNGKTGWAFLASFGNYNAMLTAAHLPIAKKMALRRYVPKTKEEALHMVYNAVRDHSGESITQILRKYSSLNYKAVFKMFGSAKSLVTVLQEQFGFDPSNIRQTRNARVPLQTLIDEVIHIALTHPEYKTAHDIIYNAPHPPTMYLKRIGRSEHIMQLVTAARDARIEAWKKRYPVKFPAKPVILRWTSRKSG